ncbi:MAG: CFI-box-CTERM domain-containing protein [Desulfobacterales bacterium]
MTKRYFHHYLSIIKKPEEQPRDLVSSEHVKAESPPEAASPEPDVFEEDKQETASPGQIIFQDEKNDHAEEPLPFDEDLDGIAEVAPIILSSPASEETDADSAEQNVSAKEAKRKFCFIATAAYGSPLAREVVLLKTFRDDHLARRFCGRKFIQGYYRVSPFLARPIGRSTLLKLLTRWLLTPIVGLIKKNFGGPGKA